MRKTLRSVAMLLCFALAWPALAQSPAPAKNPPAPATAPKASAPTAAKPPASGPVDINHASVAELKALPGIGDAYSAKIVKGRPYKSVDQLAANKIIPHATYEKIKTMIVAK